MRRPLAKSILMIGVIAAAAIAVARMVNRPPDTGMPVHPAAAVSASTISSRPLVSPADGYVGADQCRECHQDQFGSWHASYHRTMTQVVTAETAPRAILDTAVQLEGQSYRFEREGDSIFVQLNDPTDQWLPRRRQIVMMTGSHHMHVFWYESDFECTPAQLPIVYLRDAAKWVPRRSVFLQPPDEPVTYELGRWNHTCSSCHSTHSRKRPQEEPNVWQTRVSDFGIACEACHGPGEGHIAVHQEKNTDGKDDVLVNPAQLPHQAKSDVCGQYHGVREFDFEVLSRAEFLEHGSPFRPGRSLKETPFIQVIQAGPEHWQSEAFKKYAAQERKLNGRFWPDGEIRVTGADYTAMIESPCFQRGQLSCLSCHTMHEEDASKYEQWRDDQLKPAMRGNQACIQCHGEYETIASTHTHHPVGSSGSECMNCHMPYTTYGLLKTIRSHRISSPSVLTTIQTGRPNACNLCHLDKTLQWASDHLAEWYGHEKPKLTKEEKETSAAVLHFVKGDAAQRAIQASAFSWPAAREASGSEWMPPFLLLGMNDPYDAIRIISDRSLKSIGQWRDFDYEFLAPVQQRNEVITREINAVKLPSHAERSELLINEEGTLDMERLNDLLNRRNQRPVELME